MFKGLFDDNQEGKPKHRCTPGSDCGHIDDKSIWNGDHTKSQEYEYSRLATVGDLVSINRRITESNEKQKKQVRRITNSPDPVRNKNCTSETRAGRATSDSFNFLENCSFS